MSADDRVDRDAQADQHEIRHDIDDLAEAQHEGRHDRQNKADAVTRKEVAKLTTSVKALQKSVDNLDRALRSERRLLRRRGAIATTLLTIWATVPAAVAVVVLWQAVEHRDEIVAERDEIVAEAIHATCMQQKRLEQAAIGVVEAARSPRAGESPDEHAERMARIDEAVALLSSPPCDEIAPRPGEPLRR